MSGNACAGYSQNISDGKVFPCSSTATETVIAGCVHEHAGPRRMCPHHAAEVRSGLMNCGECLEAAPPHRCFLGAAR